MANTTLSESAAVDVLTATGRPGSASRVQNQGDRKMKVWFNATAPAISDPADFECQPGIDFAVDGTQKVWCWSGGANRVSVAAQVFS